jgi:hypothetical protein
VVRWEVSRAEVQMYPSLDSFILCVLVICFCIVDQVLYLGSLTTPEFHVRAFCLKHRPGTRLLRFEPRKITGIAIQIRYTNVTLQDFSKQLSISVDKQRGLVAAMLTSRL